MTATTIVQLRSAIKLDADAIKMIIKFIKNKLNSPKSTIEVNEIVDPQLIAGFKLNINGVEYDYSLTGSLNRLAQEL
ncbi:MAG: hypothetical protein DRN14_04250 [Thermoplasmata archaeon]|nr:MAG: hypothetical protein DRN14_04250 [Thermoplasmata archaeon]